MLRSVFRDGLFTNKVCLVTGGGSGIGLAVAAELASLGATVVIASRKQDRLHAAAKKIESLVAKPTAKVPKILEMNIRDEAQVSEAIKGIVSEFGTIDCLVNNGGGQFASNAADISPKGWKAVVDTNLNGTWFVTRAVYDHVPAAKRSQLAIVNVIADYFNGFPGMAHTGAARAAVDNLSKTLAREWGPDGVRVNSVAPGIIASSGVDNYPKELLPQFVACGASTPSGRCGTESEIAAAIIFLLSPAASYINGATLRVDGGGSLQKMDFVPPPPSRTPTAAYHSTTVFEDEFRERTVDRISKL